MKKLIFLILCLILQAQSFSQSFNNLEFPLRLFICRRKWEW
jgi:hypothetical protein